MKNYIPISVSVNKVLSEHSHIHSFIYFVRGWFCRTRAELSSSNEDHVVPKPKIFAVWPFTEQVWIRRRPYPCEVWTSRAEKPTIHLDVANISAMLPLSPSQSVVLRPGQEMPWGDVQKRAGTTFIVTMMGTWWVLSGQGLKMLNIPRWMGLPCTVENCSASNINGISTEKQYPDNYCDD